MGTRAAAFTAKIKNLNEIQMRLMQGSVPLPQVNKLEKFVIFKWKIVDNLSTQYEG